MANVGRNIKKIRTRKNMTQDELAEKLFVSRQTVSNYENNKSRPDVDTLVKVAGILETDINTLIYGEEIQLDRKKRVLRLLILIGITVLIFIIASALFEKAETYAKNTYLFAPGILVKNTIVPLFWGLTGWIGMEIVRLVFQITPLKGKYVNWVHRMVLGIIGMYIIVMVPVCVLEGLRLIEQIEFMNARIGGQLPMPYELPEMWQRIESQIFYWTIKYPVWIFWILGIILRATKQDTIKSNIEG